MKLIGGKFLVLRNEKSDMMVKMYLLPPDPLRPNVRMDRSSRPRPVVIHRERSGTVTTVMDGPGISIDQTLRPHFVLTSNSVLYLQRSPGHPIVNRYHSVRRTTGILIHSTSRIRGHFLREDVQWSSGPSVLLKRLTLSS